MRPLSLSLALSVSSTLFLFVGWSPSGTTTSVNAFVPQTITQQRQSTRYSQQQSVGTTCSPIVLFEAAPNGADIEDKEETIVPPPATTTPPPTSSSSYQSISSKHGTEKELREEIAERNSIVANEEKYAILDGAGMASTAIPKEDEEDDEEESMKEKESVAVVNKSESKSSVTTSETLSTTTDESTTLQKKLDRLIKQRPYPLFITEKAFEIVEDIAEGVFGKGERSSFNSQKREHIMCARYRLGCSSIP